MHPTAKQNKNSERNNKCVSPIKIINQNTIQKSNSTEISDDGVFNFDWVEVTSPKKHKRSNPTSKGNSPKSKNIKNQCNTKFVTENSYSLLSQVDKNDQIESMDEYVPAPLEKKPPSIFIKTKINDFSSFCTNIKNRIEPTAEFTCKSTTNALKFQTDTISSFRSVIKYLKEYNVDFYTYQLKDEKVYRIVIRKLYPSTKIEFIKEELGKNGHLAPNITNVLQNLTKIPLPLFFIDLEPALNKARKQLPQCMNCQNYGHTRHYCNSKPRCVRCSEQHSSESCTKNRDLPAKCTLCGGDHPANYRGCEVFNNLQTRGTKPDRQTNISNSINKYYINKHVLSNTSINNNTGPNVNIESSYSQVLKIKPVLTKMTNARQTKVPSL
jgi:hypothetical protein